MFGVQGSRWYVIFKNMLISPIFLLFPLFLQPNDTDVSMNDFSRPLLHNISLVFPDRAKVIILSSRCALWYPLHTPDETDYARSHNRKRAGRKTGSDLQTRSSRADRRLTHLSRLMLIKNVSPQQTHFFFFFLNILWTAAHVRVQRLQGQTGRACVGKMPPCPSFLTYTRIQRFHTRFEH